MNTTYTIIWQEEGPYVCLNKDTDDWGHARGELRIEYFDDARKAAIRVVSLQEGENELSSLEILVNGKSIEGSDESYGFNYLMEKFRPAAKQEKLDREDARKKAAAEEADRKMLELARRQREADEAQLAYLKKKLGVK